MTFRELTEAYMRQHGRTEDTTINGQAGPALFTRCACNLCELAEQAIIADDAAHAVVNDPIVVEEPIAY